MALGVEVHFGKFCLDLGVVWDDGFRAHEVSQNFLISLLIVLLNLWVVFVVKFLEHLKVLLQIFGY